MLRQVKEQSGTCWQLYVWLVLYQYCATVGPQEAFARCSGAEEAGKCWEIVTCLNCIYLPVKAEELYEICNGSCSLFSSPLSLLPL